MPSLADLIPEVVAYQQAQQQAQQQGQQRQAGQLAQVGALQGILAKVQAAQQQEAYRSGLRPGMSHADLINHAAQYLGPKDAATIFQGEENKKIQAEATKEAARLRIQNKVSEFNQNYRLKMGELSVRERDLERKIREGVDRNAIEQERNGIAQERLGLDRYKTAFQQQVQSEAARLAGERGAYDFGFSPSSPLQPNVVSPTATASGERVSFQRNTPEADLNIVNQPMGLLEALAARDPTFRSALSQATQQPSQSQPVAPPPSPVETEEQGAPPAFPGFTGYIPPQNQDTEMRRFGSGTAPVAAPTVAAPQGPVAAPAAPTIVPKPPEYASWPQRKKDEYDSRQQLAQTRPSIAGNASISPETATRIAEQALSGDFSGAQGWSRNMTAKAQIEDAITKLANERGKKGGELTGAKAMTAANRVALTASTKDLMAIQPFKEMLDLNADVAIQLGRKIANDKTNSAFVNRPLIWVKNNLSDRPDIAEYLAQMHFVEVESARVLTQPRLVGQLTDQAISDMKSILSGNMTIASTEAVINRIKADGNNRINAMKSAQARTLAEISGKPVRTRSTDTATGVDTNNPLLR